jgi:hypothetical protein
LCLVRFVCILFLCSISSTYLLSFVRFYVFSSIPSVPPDDNKETVNETNAVDRDADDYPVLALRTALTPYSIP